MSFFIGCFLHYVEVPDILEFIVTLLFILRGGCFVEVYYLFFMFSEFLDVWNFPYCVVFHII